MRKFLFFTLALAFATAGIIAQTTHQNSTEKPVKQRVTFDNDIRVGPELLKAGDYRVECDRETIVFKGPDGKTFKFPCKGEEMKEASDHNEIHTSPGDGNTRVLTKLLLRGSNVQHEFK